MKINWKVRLKNPVFWLTVIPAVIALVYTVLGLFGVVPTISEDKIVNAVTAIISALTTIGVLVDPTTKGICDSDRALCYDAPVGAENEKNENIN
ncbi:MAG: phage holin [Acutalibacteraceae bacterium]